MNKISLIGIEFYSYHGFYKEERIIGGKYLLDVEVGLNVRDSFENDDLTQTLNYESIFGICKKVMSSPVNLIETIAFKIEEDLQKLSKEMNSIKIIVHKLSPPMGSTVTESKFELNKNYRRICSRCKKEFKCYNSKTCWCQNYSLSSNDLQKIKANYVGCLCASCFSEIENKV